MDVLETQKEKKKWNNNRRENEKVNQATMIFVQIKPFRFFNNQ